MCTYRKGEGAEGHVRVKFPSPPPSCADDETLNCVLVYFAGRTRAGCRGTHPPLPPSSLLRNGRFAKQPWINGIGIQVALTWMTFDVDKAFFSFSHSC